MNCESDIDTLASQRLNGARNESSIIPFPLHADTALASRADIALERNVGCDLDLDGGRRAAGRGPLLDTDVNVLGQVFTQTQSRTFVLATAPDPHGVQTERGSYLVQNARPTARTGQGRHRLRQLRGFEGAELSGGLVEKD